MQERLIPCLKLQTGYKHHFIARKAKKTYLTDSENSHEKQQTGVFCELKTCFDLPLSGHSLPHKGQCYFKMFIS